MKNFMENYIKAREAYKDYLMKIPDIPEHQNFSKNFLQKRDKMLFNLAKLRAKMELARKMLYRES